MLKLYNNYTYDGIFKNNLKHGHGKELMSDKSMYEGEFFAGLRCGKGKIQFGYDDKSFY